MLGMKIVFQCRMLLTLIVVSAGFVFIIMGIIETDHKKKRLQKFVKLSR